MRNYGSSIEMLLRAHRPPIWGRDIPSALDIASVGAVDVLEKEIDSLVERACSNTPDKHASVAGPSAMEM